MTLARPAGWAVANITRGIYVEAHWYSDRDVAMGALNWWGTRVYPGEGLMLLPIRRWPMPRPAWLDEDDTAE